MELPEFESRLVVRNVDGLDIDDPAQIRTYQLTDLEYQLPRLTLEAGQELSIVVEVSELDVECELNMNRYEWSAPGATALVVPVRAADPVIGEHRRAHTPSGKQGMPAHATLLAPFIHASRLDSLDRHRLSDTVGRFPAFDLRLSAFGTFEHIGCLWLAPQPRKQFVEMTKALLEIYPEVEYPPESAAEIVPHVTIGSRLTEEQQEEIKRELQPKLPIRGRVDRVVLYERDAKGGWRARQTFALF
jgi:2'-5' RNA ligase